MAGEWARVERRLDDYLSEREQVDKIREFFKENGAWMLFTLAAVTFGFSGWKWWQRHQDAQGQAAGARYQQVLDALTRDDRGAADKIQQGLRADFGNSPYADQGDLALARANVEGGHLPDAEQHLISVMNGSRDQELRLVARLRLARVQIAADKPKDALKTLSGAEPKGFASGYAQARGDALLATGDRAGALAAYREALAAPVQGMVDAQSVQRKIDDLGGNADAPGPPAKAPPGAVPMRTGPAAPGAKP
jgi:predicted negative regulator of RcsB-dependent stress response